MNIVLILGFLGVLDQHCTACLILYHMEDFLHGHLSEFSPSGDGQIGFKISVLLGE